jgi:hypothetical protein
MILLRQRNFSKAGLAKKAERAAKKALKNEWQMTEAKKTYFRRFPDARPSLGQSRRGLQQMGATTNGTYVEDTIAAGGTPILAKINGRSGKFIAGHSAEGAHTEYGAMARRWTR